LPFVDLHCHSEYSALDGLSNVWEMTRRAAGYGAPALAITDHENCSGHPEFQAACDKAGIKPIFGMETYFVPDRHNRSKAYDYTHLILLAMNEQGLHDLWALSTEAFATGKHYRARCDWELLERYGQNLIVTSACLGGPIAEQFKAGNFDAADALIRRFKGLLGDRFYFEIQPNQLAEQIKMNRYLAAMSERHGVPLVAATDAHYPEASQERLHKLWMACNASGSDPDYWNYIHMFGPDEVWQGLSYLGADVADRAMAHSVAIAERCTARIEGHAKPPVFTRGGTARDDVARLQSMILENWQRGMVPHTQEHQDRLVREMDLIARKELAGSYLIVEDVIRWTRSHGKLVGPGRGSAAGSLVSYALRITTMDPLPAGLLFERFLTEGRTALPDFDMDFPTSWRPHVTNYMVSRYGEQSVVRVGTTGRFRTKGILKKLFSVMQHGLAPEWFDDSRLAASIVDEAEAGEAGLGLSWDEVMEHEELKRLAAKYEKVFEAAAQLHGRVHTYGQHPAGLVISTDTDLTQNLPLRLAEDKKLLIAQYDFRALEALGLFKLDFLTLRTIDTLQTAIELVERRTGQRIDPANWSIHHEDPQVWEEIGTGQTKGLFQLESGLCSTACLSMKPVDLAELAVLISYIRPGPRNSGLAASYLARRAGTEEVSYPFPELEEALGTTFGVMLFQEDILAVCRLLAGYDSGEADKVRKILGKKQTDKIQAAGEEFIRRCTERGHDEARVTELWAAMAEFGKYGFNRAHAYAYATLGYWTAWFKVHYPVEMFTAILSTVKKERHHEFATDARRLGVRILPPDVQFCGADFQPEQLSIRYGLSSLLGVGPAKISKIVRGQPYADFADFVTRSGVDVGTLAVLGSSGALDSLVPTRRGLMTVIEADRSGDATRCVHKDENVKDNYGLPCRYDWNNEPVPVRIGARGQQLKPQVKPVPKSCTRACRHYTPPSAIDATTIPEYGAAELWELDQQVFGTWMSDAVFAQMPERIREQGREIARLAMNSAPHEFTLLAVYNGGTAHTSRRGTTYWRVRLATEVSDIRAVVFQPRDGEPDVPAMLDRIKQGTLIAAKVAKERYWANGWRTSWHLTDLTPLGR
jgi:DNA polymerase III subunit alpha